MRSINVERSTWQITDPFKAYVVTTNEILDERVPQLVYC